MLHCSIQHSAFIRHAPNNYVNIKCQDSVVGQLPAGLHGASCMQQCLVRHAATAHAMIACHHSAEGQLHTGLHESAWHTPCKGCCTLPLPRRSDVSERHVASCMRLLDRKCSIQKSAEGQLHPDLHVACCMMLISETCTCCRPCTQTWHIHSICLYCICVNVMVPTYQHLQSCLLHVNATIDKQVHKVLHVVEHGKHEQFSVCMVDG